MSAAESRARGKSGKFIRTPDTAERDAEAARMRAGGLGLREIADTLGYAAESGAHKAISRALAAIPAQAVAELRKLENDRLDRLTVAAWAVLDRRYPLVTQGGRLVKGPDGEQLYDDGPALQAVDRLLRICERRAKLMGLDAAKRYEVPASGVTLEAIDAEIARLHQDLAQYDAPQEAS